MAMTLDTAIKFTAKLEGTGLDQLKRNLQGLSQQSNVSKRSLDQLYTATKVLGSASNNTVAGLQRTVGALKALRDQAEFGSRKFKLLTSDIEAAEARLRRFQGAASASGGLSRGGALLAGFAGGVAGSLTTMATSGAMDAARGVVQAGLAAETAQVRLKALTEQFGEYNAAQAAAARIAQTLRISQTEAQDSFSKLYAALRPTGVTLKEVEDAYIGFTAAARASGATAVESAAALEQLKQALGSGVLQGDELRSIREQAPAVGQAIAKEMGVTVGELKKLGEEGKITTDVVLKALATLKNEKLDDLNAQFNTGAQALKDLQIAAESVGKSISRIFGPTALAVVRDFAAGLQDVATVLGNLSGDKGAEAVLKDRVRARDQAAAEAGSRFGLFDLGGKETYFRQRQDQLFQQFQRERAATGPTDQPTAAQQQAQDAAERERVAGRERIAMDAAKKRLAEELKIREDTEKRLADFREQSIRRAADLERDLGDQRLQLERSTAEARRRIAAQEQDFQLERERLRLRGAGLSTDALDTQARLNEATRRFTEQKIQIEQNATDQKVRIERALADYQLSVARGISEILQDAADKMAKKMATGGQAAAAAMTGSAMPSGGFIARTGNTGDTTGPHLDARWANGRRITAADADRYLSVNGRDPSSYGVTSGYGPRSMFGRSFHAGMDFGTPSGSGISLKGGASLLRDLGFTGAGGYAVEIMTPEGPMRLLHLQGGSAARPAGSARQLIGASGVTAAGQRLDAAVGANRSTNMAAAAGDLVNSRQAELGNITSQLDQQRKSIREQREDYERMVELQRSGMSPELAQQTVQRERAATAERSSLQVLEQQVVKDLESKDITGEQRANLEAILQTTRDRLAAQSGIVQGLSEEERKLQQLQQAYEQKKQLAQGIADSIGNGIGQALDLVINGTENWGDSLRTIAAGVLKDIARQLLQILVIQPIVKGIAAGLGGITFADGGIMTSDGPVPLRKYAGGGIASSPQLAMFGEGSTPEAYVPLPDGRRIPVAMKGGGGGNTVVNVSVDAKGTSVQGNAGQGEQLARVVAQAVQAELVRQKRPGGLIAA
jgi:tape measure domain-containing protein